MSYRVFISLTGTDAPIAEALKTMLKALFGDFIETGFSTSKELGTGIRTGEDWFQWIVQQVRECEFALILVTPFSVNKPWILWEAGAVAGAAVASMQNGLRKVRPLVFQVPYDMIPSPIRDSQVQFRRGEDALDVRVLMEEIFEECENKMLPRIKIEFGKMLDETITKYLAAVDTHLLEAPALANNMVIEEWRLRLDDVLAQSRFSEVETVHSWMDVAFAREHGERLQPLDLRIHGRLATLYRKAKRYTRAIEQLELARQLAPRDIFVLRELGRVHLEVGDRAKAKEVIDRIEKLDRNAYRNTECAALAGRWYREGGNLARAEQIFASGLDHNRESYYLANVLAEVQLERGHLDEARDTFQRALNIVKNLTGEANVWTHATAANAEFVLGNDDNAREHLLAVNRFRPDADSVATIEKALKILASKMDNAATRAPALLRALRGMAQV
jgi:tetratricopeptide (TPR) repeat protein